MNSHKNQIIVDINDITKYYTKKLENPFGFNKRLVIFPRNDIEGNIFNFAKEYLNPKLKYCLWFRTDEIITNFITTLQNNFRAKSFDLVITNNKVKDVVNEEEQLKLIKNIHNEVKKTLESTKLVRVLEETFTGLRW